MSSVPNRWEGSWIAPGISVATPPVRAVFVRDPVLEQRRRAAREALGPVPSVERKTPRLILDEVSYQVATIPDDLQDLPIG